MGNSHTKARTRRDALTKSYEELRAFAYRTNRMGWAILAVATIMLLPPFYWFAYWVAVDKSDPLYSGPWNNPTYSQLISPQPFNAFFNFWVGIQLVSLAFILWGNPAYMSYSEWEHIWSDVFLIIIYVAYAVFARCPVTDIPICHDITLGTFFLFVVIVMLWAAHLRTNEALTLNATVVIVFAVLFVITTIDKWQDRSRDLANVRAAFEHIAIMGIQVAPFIWKYEWRFKFLPRGDDYVVPIE